MSSTRPLKPQRDRPIRRARPRGWRALRIIIAVIVGLLAFGVGGVEAADGMRGNNCVVAEDEVIGYDFYFLCNTLTIHGTIQGDLIGVASRVNIRRGSVVDGDLWIAAGQLVVEGNMRDDIRFGGAKLQISRHASFADPSIDIAAAAISVNIDPEARLPGDLLMMGYQAIIDGNVGGTVDFQGQALVIRGLISGNVDAIVGDRRTESPLRTVPLPYDIDLESPGFVVHESAVIVGNLRYEAPQQVTLQRSNVQGTIRYRQSLQQADITRVEQTDTFWAIARNFLINVIKETVSLMIVGLFALQFVPVLMSEPGKRVQQAYLPAASWGFMMFILSFPIAFFLILASVLLVFVITLVTLSSMTVAASLFLAVINVVLIGGFWFFLVFVGPAITCFVIGKMLLRFGRRLWLQRHHDPDDPPVFVTPLPRRHRWVGLALGVVLYSLVVNLPGPSSLNTLLLFLQGGVACTGLGAIFMYGRDLWHMSREEWLPADVSSDRMDSLPLDQDVPLGLENLPEGFDGFYDE